MNGLNMDVDQKLAYKNDKRIPCIFGVKCYQKNPIHHEKYKHPPKPKTDEPMTNEAKRQKLDDESKPTWEEDREKDIYKFIKASNDLPKKDDRSEHKSTDAASTVTSSEIDVGSDNNESTAHKFIKEKFLVDMPPDFYSFWELSKSLNGEEPLETWKLFDLYLVGPFDVLAQKFVAVSREPAVYLRHWRYYYDPPEFQTILRVDNPSFDHYGYFRDSPDELPCFVAAGQMKNGELVTVADNIFGAVEVHIENYKKKHGHIYKALEIRHLQKALHEWAKANDFTLDTVTAAMQTRNKRVVAKTFTGVGIVVPYNRKTKLGYRPLNESNEYIRKLLKNIVECDKGYVRDRFFSVLQPLLAYASIAADECDFGTGLELGLDLFAYGGDVLHDSILSLLKTAYNLLGRQAFAKIIEAHFEYRTKKPKLSIL